MIALRLKSKVGVGEPRNEKQRLAGTRVSDLAGIQRSGWDPALISSTPQIFVENSGTRAAFTFVCVV